MSGNLTTIALSLEVASDSDESERIELARQLRRSLLDLSEVESVEASTVPVAPRAKAAGIDWQTLLVTLAASGGVITTLIGTIQGLLARRPGSSVRLRIGQDEVNVEGASAESTRLLISEWIARHGQ